MLKTWLLVLPGRRQTHQNRFAPPAVPTGGSKISALCQYAGVLRLCHNEAVGGHLDNLSSNIKMLEVYAGLQAAYRSKDRRTPKCHNIAERHRVPQKPLVMYPTIPSVLSR